MNIDSFANSKFVEHLTNFGNKIGNNKYIQAISQGMMMALPIVIVGSIVGMFAGLRIEAWQGFLAASGLGKILGFIVNATTNMLGLYFTYGIARALSEKEGLTSKIIPLFAIIAYIALLPFGTLESGETYLLFDYLGTKGMIVGILLAILTVKVYAWISSRNLVIKMPAGTPDYVAQSFISLIPGFAQALLIIIIAYLVNFTPYDSIFELLYSTIQIPLVGLVGGSLITNIIFQLLTQASWSIGLHPGYLSSLSGPVLMSLDGQNQAAFATGAILPNIIGLSFSYITTIAVLYPAIAVAVLVFSKSERLKNIGKVSLAPAIFGISEPLIFGLPVIFNPIIWIPWIIAPIINFSLGYFLTSIGLVSRTAGVIVFNMPMVITGLLNGSFTISLMEIGLFVLDILLFAPFIMIIDKKYQKEESVG